jgi:hypothetical protein
MAARLEKSLLGSASLFHAAGDKWARRGGHALPGRADPGRADSAQNHRRLVVGLDKTTEGL